MRSKTGKTRSQFGLGAATRPHEVGVASNRDQHVAVNTFPGLVHTARQTMELGAPEASDPTARRELSKVNPMTRVKS